MIDPVLAPSAALGIGTAYGIARLAKFQRRVPPMMDDAMAAYAGGINELSNMRIKVLDLTQTSIADIDLLIEHIEASAQRAVNALQHTGFTAAELRSPLKLLSSLRKQIRTIRSFMVLSGAEATEAGLERLVTIKREVEQKTEKVENIGTKVGSTGRHVFYAMEDALGERITRVASLQDELAAALDNFSVSEHRRLHNLRVGVSKALDIWIHSKHHLDTLEYRMTRRYHRFFRQRDTVIQYRYGLVSASNEILRKRNELLLSSSERLRERVSLPEERKRLKLTERSLDKAEKRMNKDITKNEKYLLKEEKKQAKIVAREEAIAAKEQEELEARKTWSDDQIEDLEEQARLAIENPPDPIGVLVPDEKNLEAEFLKRLKREGAGKGKIQVSLMWFDRNDLDLHILTPDAGRIYHGKKTDEFGGELNVDMNVRGDSKKPIENVVWPEATAKPGNYQVWVHHYKQPKKRGATDPCVFRIRIQIGKAVSEYQAQVSTNTPPAMVCVFEIPERKRQLGARRVRADDVQSSSDEIDEEDALLIEMANAIKQAKTDKSKNVIWRGGPVPLEAFYQSAWQRWGEDLLEVLKQPEEELDVDSAARMIRSAKALDENTIQWKGVSYDLAKFYKMAWKRWGDGLITALQNPIEESESPESDLQDGMSKREVKAAAKRAQIEEKERLKQEKADLKAHAKAERARIAEEKKLQKKGVMQEQIGPAETIKTEMTVEGVALAIRKAKNAGEESVLWDGVGYELSKFYQMAWKRWGDDLVTAIKNAQPEQMEPEETGISKKEEKKLAKEKLKRAKIEEKERLKREKEEHAEAKRVAKMETAAKKKNVKGVEEGIKETTVSQEQLVEEAPARKTKMTVQGAARVIREAKKSGSSRVEWDGASFELSEFYQMAWKRWGDQLIEEIKAPADEK